MPRPITDVAIIGAGPYGLSIAAHLRARGIAYRIFGQPMLTWQKLPRGTYLKSLGWATDVYTPGRRQNFTTYCRERNLEAVEPCAMSDFAQFGIWLQSWAVPDLETTEIHRFVQVDDGFAVTTAENETFTARWVIVAVGLTHFARIPKELENLPAGLVSHTSEHSSFERFAGQEVCVLGAGASALDCAAKLLEVAARPLLLVRGSWIGFSWKTPATRKFWDRIRRPDSVLGFGLRSWIFEKFPGLCHHVPDAWRVRFHQTNYGPLGGWWLRDQVEGKVPLRTKCTLVRAAARGHRLALTVREEGQGELEILCDHVIAGTGYDINVDRLPFLDGDVKARVRRLENAPALDRHFESSVRGLYFVGVASSLSFGPLFRFVAGAEYTAQTLTRVLARRGATIRLPVPASSPPESRDDGNHRAAATSAHAQASARPMKILLVCTASNIAYKVLRCAALGGREVYVMGDDRSAELKSSSYCARYLPSRFPIGQDHLDDLAAEINGFIAAHGIAMVLPGDTGSTRVLAAVQSSIQARVFPLPEAAVFDRLANKWTFKNLCDSLGVPSPASRLVADKTELEDALKAHGGAGWIAKPIDREGGSGFARFNAKLLVSQIELIDYQPIMLQDYVSGRDLCISLLCHEGEPIASATYTHDKLSIHFTHHEELERQATRIAAHFKYSGVLCFDARLDPDGKVFFIECNPRFWNHVDAAMIGGVNFVELGLPSSRPSECARIEDGTHFRNVIGVRQQLRRLRSISLQDLKVLVHWLKDYPFWLRQLVGNRRPQPEISALDKLNWAAEK